MTPHPPALRAVPAHGPGTGPRTTVVSARAAIHWPGAASRTVTASVRAAAHGPGARPRTAAAPAATLVAVPASLSTVVAHGPCPNPTGPFAAGPDTTERSEAA
ncbi:hypothetical protein [Streptomyces sp. S1]|uniref:hypothetical protein n=1 Tax=Streptomyces sp. S1 TaxID=718288 RepID=UPI000EF7F704|nr:hypothetical protein [Streptomyces sp. S1]